MSETATAWIQDGLPTPPLGASVYSAVMTAGGAAVIIPPRGKLAALFINESTNHAITGGLNIGTTLNGSDIAAAVAVAGNALVPLWPASLLKTWFSLTSNTTIYISAVTSFNSANLVVQAVYFF